jgi:mannose-1-phosphate guanylyltransferase
VIDTAIILAAGLGTRLAPLSLVRAKAVLPVGGEVLIRRQVRWLAAAGVTEVIVNLHHLPETITSLLGHGDDLGVAVRYSWEPVVLGPAGGPRRAFALTNAERAFIVNGDMVTDVDLGALAEEHAHAGRLVTMAAVASLTGYNSLVVSDEGSFVGVARWGAPSDPAHVGLRRAHFIGVQLAERGAFDAVPVDTPAETLKWLYPSLVASSPSSVRVWSTDASYHDIGTPADYLATATRLAEDAGQPLDRGAAVHVADSAVVDGTIMWDRVSVGEGADVRDSVLADDVSIPSGLRLRGVAVVPRAVVARDVPGDAMGQLWVTPLGVSAG